MTRLFSGLNGTIGETLPSDLRGQLEAAVRAAREAAEAGAQAALLHLGVTEEEAPAHLDEPQRQLRRRLRAHARVLGDPLANDGTQAIQRLVWESAYEHWHRMLFARVLAERHLLIWEGGVSVTLDECHELAGSSGATLGVRSGWELAGRLAERMLPSFSAPIRQCLLCDLRRSINRRSNACWRGCRKPCFWRPTALVGPISSGRASARKR